MIISPVTSSPFTSIVSPVNLQSLVSALSSSSPLTTFGGVNLVGSSAIVELSGLGQLLSAVSIFENGLAKLQPGSLTSGIGQNFGTDFASLAAEAQSFVDSFNNLQNSLASLQAPFGALSGEPLSGQFNRALNALATASFQNDNALLTNLGQIGINFTSSGTGNGTLSINLQTLQTAFTTDPTRTFELLGQAVRSFGDLAAGFAGQAGSASAALGWFTQFGFGQAEIEQQDLTNLFLLESLSQRNTVNSGLPFLFGAGLMGGSSMGLAEMLALRAFSQGSDMTFAQQLTAMNQFNLVSSLLG